MRSVTSACSRRCLPASLARVGARAPREPWFGSPRWLNELSHQLGTRWAAAGHRPDPLKVRAAQGPAETELGINTTIAKLGLGAFVLEDACSGSGLTRSRTTRGEDPMCHGRRASRALRDRLVASNVPDEGEIKAWGGLGGEPKPGLRGAALAAPACSSAPEGKAGRGGRSSSCCLRAGGVRWRPPLLKIR